MRRPRSPVEGVRATMRAQKYCRRVSMDRADKQRWMEPATSQPSRAHLQRDAPQKRPSPDNPCDRFGAATAGADDEEDDEEDADELSGIVDNVMSFERVHGSSGGQAEAGAAAGSGAHRRPWMTLCCRLFRTGRLRQQAGRTLVPMSSSTHQPAVQPGQPPCGSRRRSSQSGRRRRRRSAARRMRSRPRRRSPATT